MAFKLHVYVSDYVGKEGLYEVLTEVLLFGVPVTTALSTTRIINDKVSIFKIFWDTDTLKHFTLLIQFPKYWQCTRLVSSQANDLCLEGAWRALSETSTHTSRCSEWEQLQDVLSSRHSVIGNTLLTQGFLQKRPPVASSILCKWILKHCRYQKMY